MARLEDLVKRIPEAALRAEVQAGVAELKKHRQFGLVFEEHIPETVALSGLPVQVGSLVTDRQHPGAGALLVTEVDARKKRVQAVPEAGGDAREAVLSDLLVVKRFGEPVFPSLEPVDFIGRGGDDRAAHAVIDGENFHALQLLVHFFEQQADCIYIDPPYNTGARDWKYNNQFIDKSDSWRHSKWLSMMEKRLRLAKRLLRPDGVLIVTIDEHEVHHLGMLLERRDLFPDPDYSRQAVTIVINPKGTAKTHLARVEEYAIFVIPNIGRDVLTPRPRADGVQGDLELWDIDAAEDDVEGDDDEPAVEGEEGDDDVTGEESLADAGATEDDAGADIEWRHARRRGAESSYRHQRPNQFYPIFIDEKTREVVRVGPSIELEKKPSLRRVDGLRPVWPIDRNGDDRCWAFSPDSMQKRIDRREVRVTSYNKMHGTWTLNYAVPRKTTRKWKTVWRSPTHDAGTHGTELVRRLLGRPGLFPFPKSVYAVRDCLSVVVGNRPNALIVDFFAGSGTTLHATCLLNKADGGQRRTILVTNNEVDEKTTKRLNSEGLFRGDPDFERHGIFQQVTMPRIKAALTGRRPDGVAVPGKHVGGPDFAQGFSENVMFYRLRYLDPDRIMRGLALDSLFPALWLAGGGLGQRDGTNSDKGYLMPSNARFAVLLSVAKFAAFRRALAERTEIGHVWLVTDSSDAFAEMRSELPAHLHVERLYYDYLRKLRLLSGASV